MKLLAALTILRIVPILAQTAPAFEVASVKPTAAEPGSSSGVATGKGRVTGRNVTLKRCIRSAYDVPESQVFGGPKWVDEDRYDIDAKAAGPAGDHDMMPMLRTLLAERFKLVFHRETKPMPVFALVVGKGGSKMKEVETPAAPVGPPDGRASLQSRTAYGPGMRIMMSPNGTRMAGQMTMAQLCNALSRQLERPVLDQTELSGTYDVAITFMPDDMDRMNAKMAQMAPLAGGPGGPGGPGIEGPRGAPEPTLTLAQALQEKLGLKLEARKSAAEILIIDRAEKAPVEN